ncbi:DUF6311 domain-containing protein [Qipengyuania sp. MTN3-11]|uniref:DUF6311 domain-containing protein n=1 Tax=Qipengyuania sp. MTN3-11 TaxID=3056557 RepID=UPI0036F285D6
MTALGSRRVGRWEWLAAAGLGVAIFLVVAGPQILDPTNDGWLLNKTAVGEYDRSAHYLAWLQYAQDEWRWPLGANPNYGLELGNSTVYSDSVPLLAAIAKLIAKLTGAQFHYFGFWVLLCFAMQAVVGYRIAAIFDDGRLFRIAGTALIVLTPPFVERFQRHITLGGHFLVLLGVLLVLDRRIARKPVWWIGLFMLATAIHFYLLAMVAALYLADLVMRLREGARPLHVIAELVLAELAILLVAWQSGYFTVQGSVQNWGYGLFSMNLLAPIVPMGFGLVLPEIAVGPGQGEGFNYLGLGILMLLAIALGTLARGRVDIRPTLRRFWPLLLVSCGLAAFAVTHALAFGPWSATLPLPERLTAFGGILRSSGRMFWPVVYLLVAAGLWLIARGFSERRRAVLLCALVLVQLVDIAPGIAKVRQSFVDERAFAPLESTDPFWSKVPRRYAKLRWMMPMDQSPHWLQLAEFAGRHGMATDAVYLARMDGDAYDALERDTKTAIAQGRFAPDTLYVLDEDIAEEVSKAYDPERDSLGRVGNLTVLAPGLAACETCVRPEPLN